MVRHLLEGIQVGLLLALLVGPLLLVLVQAGVERGFRAGLAAAAGIWVSDLLCILAVTFGLARLERIVEGPGFELGLGVGGAVLLTAFGLASLLAPAPSLSAKQQQLASTASYGRLFAKGFLVNTVNPFTIIFWISITGTMVVKRNLPEAATQVFYLGIMLTILLTDTGKVLLAKRIRRYLQARHIRGIRRVAGLALLVFGAVLLLRVLWPEMF